MDGQKLCKACAKARAKKKKSEKAKISATNGTSPSDDKK